MKKFVLCLVLASMTVALRSGYTQDKSLKKIRWGVTSLSASQWIPWIAKDAKIYEKHGLDTELILLRGSGRDVILITIGNTPERIQALVSGGVDAADLNYPADAQAERLGFKVLWDAKQEVSYPSMSVVTRRKSVLEDRDTVMRMVKAHVEAIHYLKANKEFSLKVLSKYLKTNDRELLEGSYEIYRNDFISVPYPITQGLQATYDYVALQRPDVWKHKPETFMDASFIAELEKTGFIARLSERLR